MYATLGVAAAALPHPPCWQTAIQRAAGQHFVLEEASVDDVPGVSRAEGGRGESSSTWIGTCRTKFVGLDGKPLPPPSGGHDAPLA